VPYRSLSAVQRDVVACTRCPRLRTHCRRIARVKKREFQHWTYWGKPVKSFGDPNARLLIVGLAPAAHGANRTGRMFTGDSSGSWLYDALHRYGFANQPNSLSLDDGLVLEDCYITAAARCAPPGNKPTPAELARCSRYLEAEIGLLRRVRVTLTLGRIGHDAWGKLVGQAGRRTDGEGWKPKFAHGAVHVLPNGMIQIDSYHPSRQNTNTGKLTREMWYAIFEKARELLDRGQVSGVSAPSHGT